MEKIITDEKVLRQISAAVESKNVEPLVDRLKEALDRIDGTF